MQVLKLAIATAERFELSPEHAGRITLKGSIEIFEDSYISFSEAILMKAFHVAKEKAALRSQVVAVEKLMEEPGIKFDRLLPLIVKQCTAAKAVSCPPTPLPMEAVTKCQTVHKDFQGEASGHHPFGLHTKPGTVSHRSTPVTTPMILHWEKTGRRICGTQGQRVTL